jgi:transcriptional regulator of acetoin/glycerol metabolism
MSHKVQIEKHRLRLALEATSGFIMPAAAQLGVARVTLSRRVREHGLEAMARRLRCATGWTWGHPMRRS